VEVLGRMTRLSTRSPITAGDKVYIYDIIYIHIYIQREREREREGGRERE
jgi:hypothetical protein